MVAVAVKQNNGQQTTIDEAALDAFITGMRGEVLTPESDNYDEVRTIWNNLMHSEKRPALIARCTGVADVIEAVNFAREHGLLVAVRGGGHNVAGSATCDGGIMIDLSLMNGVHVDSVNKTARVQGGATWGDVDRETQVFGLATAGGVVSTTGVAGLTLGGGFGHLRRKYGLTIDSLLAVDIVTADGKLLTASESENADLFWGIRGGGGNFGIVTSFLFRLYPVGPMVSVCAPFYPTEDAGRIFRKWRDFMETAPDEISSIADFWAVPPDPNLPAEHHNKRALLLAAVHCGSVEDGERIMQPLRELGTPLVDLSGPYPWAVLQSFFDPLMPKAQRHYYFKSRYMKRIDDATIDAIVERASHPPVSSLLVALWHMGGAMQKIDTAATAFYGRQVPLMLSVDCIWDDPAMSDEVIKYARTFLADMEKYSTGGMYVNFAGFGEEGEKIVRDVYGAHYDRLKKLKAKYDPTNLFRLNQNIKPQ